MKKGGEKSNMATPENSIKILHQAENPLRRRQNGNQTIIIYADGTACEGQNIEPYTPCYWTGFDKETGEFFGRPKKENES